MKAVKEQPQFRLTSNFTFRTMQKVEEAILLSLIPISNADWRKTTWIAPEDAHKAPGTKYKTLLTDDAFADMPPYTGIKFRPKNGEMNDYTIGAAVDYPLMRIEEMYLIEAEAIGMSQGLADGISKLEDFRCV